MLVKSMLAGGLVAVLAIGAAKAADCTLSPQGEAGKSAASACKGCHEFDPAKPSRPTGPNLAGIFGAKAGQAADFPRYSEAMKAAAGKLTWDEASLVGYVGDPKGFLAGVNGRQLKNGMFFALKDQAKRQDIAVYLKELAACR